MRVAIFQTDLKLGGIQRSLINLLKIIDTDKYQVDLYLFSRENFYETHFPEGVNVIYIKGQGILSRIVPFKLYLLFKRVMINQQYDIAIDFNGYQSITAAYALKVSASRSLYWVHSDAYVRRDEPVGSILHRIYVRLLLSKSKWRSFDGFIGVSDGVLDGFRRDFADKYFLVIPNSIDTDEIQKKSREDITDLNLERSNVNLAVVGRLEHAKGLDLLLPRLADVVAVRQDLRVYIIGDGSRGQSLREQVDELGLSNYVHFLGSRSNPFKYLTKMDGLILNSRYEGQGMVLMEALCLGLPIFFPEHLEKYNVGLKGVEDMTKTLLSVKKYPKHKFDPLDDYNRGIKTAIDEMLSGATL